MLHRFNLCLLNKIYIVESVFDGYIIVSELPRYIYNINRFISLLEFRKMKINKIKDDIRNRRQSNLY